MYYISNTIKGATIVYDFDNERPIYLQLVEQLRVEILSGKLALGEKLPSVRDFALQAKVNPNTMQKALAELERERLIYTERTNGKYVTTDERVIEKLREQVINQKVESFLRDMHSIGVDRKLLLKHLKTRQGGKNAQK